VLGVSATPESGRGMNRYAMGRFELQTNCSVAALAEA